MVGWNENFTFDMTRRGVLSLFKRSQDYTKQLFCTMRMSRPLFACQWLFVSNAATTSAFVTQHSQFRGKSTIRYLSSTGGIEKSPEDNVFSTEYHAPVMWKECVDSLLDCERSRSRGIQETDIRDMEPLIFIDGTLGGGGHSAALLENLDAGDILFGCDVDSEALETASERLKKYMDHDGSELPFFIPVHSNFGDLDYTVPQAQHPITQQTILEEGVDGILLDLGVSSHQIDTAERGFAFMKVSQDVSSYIPPAINFFTALWCKSLLSHLWFLYISLLTMLCSLLSKRSHEYTIPCLFPSITLLLKRMVR